MTANLQGVGLVLGDDTVGAKIIKVVKNGPADKSGKFKKNDIITKINGKEISNLPLSDIVDLIRGKKGTSVKLSASREDSKTKKITKFEVSLTRDIVPLMDQKAKADEFTIDGKRIVVINLPGFYYDTASQVGSAYDIMEQYNNMKKKGNIDAIVLDLRYNGGGVLEEAIRVSGIFIEKPISVQVRDTSGVRRFQSASPPVLIKEPLVVLISRVSASASEIVAGALKDYGRAVIVGDDRTYGKGTVQSVIGSLRSAQLGMIKVTTGKFYTPEGGSTQIKGVTSDVKIPSSTQIQDFGETNMRFALDWTRVDSVFNKSSSSPLSNLINELGKNSSNRVKSNADFERFKDMSSYRKWSEAQKKEDESEDEEVSRINPEKDLVLKESLNIAKDLSILIKPKEVSSSPVSK